jgi:hypothetical protein
MRCPLITEEIKLPLETCHASICLIGLKFLKSELRINVLMANWPSATTTVRQQWGGGVHFISSGTNSAIDVDMVLVRTLSSL